MTRVVPLVFACMVALAFGRRHDVDNKHTSTDESNETDVTEAPAGKYVSDSGKLYPTHWGGFGGKKEGTIRLPGGYGRGSEKLKKWIQKKIKGDEKMQHLAPNGVAYPMHWGEPRGKANGDVELPGDYGLGSTQLNSWIRRKRLNDKETRKGWTSRIYCPFNYCPNDLEWTERAVRPCSSYGKEVVCYNTKGQGGRQCCTEKKAPKIQYVNGDKHSNKCPRGSAPLSVSECQQVPSTEYYTETSPQFPSGCYKYNKDGKDWVIFNFHPNGASHKESSPVCKKRPACTDAGFPSKECKTEWHEP